MSPEADPEAPALVRNGAQSYAHALTSAGGKQVEALMRKGERNLFCAAAYASPPYDLRVPPLPVSRLSVNLTRASVSGGVDGEQRRRYDALRYSMFYVPAGLPVEWRKNSSSRHLNIYFHVGEFGSMSDGEVAFDRDRPVFNAQVVGIRQLVDQLAAELDNPDPLAAEAVDSLARLIVVRLARQLSNSCATRNALSRKAVASLRDFILAHLSERILVADLAREAGLPPNRFAQAFNHHARVSPHQFVLALRLERATQLLRSSRVSLVEVAHECGFANQQHLSNAMRRQLGTTPSLYRRAHSPRTEPGV